MPLIKITVNNLRDLHELTENNLHTEAMEFVAKLLESPRLENEFNKVSREQDKIGYLSESLYQHRTALRRELQNMLQQKLGKEDYKRVYKAL